MPVEIRELIIRAYADERPEQDKPRKGNQTVDHEAIVAECIEQVMEILKFDKER